MNRQEMSERRDTVVSLEAVRHTLHSDACPHVVRRRQRCFNAITFTRLREGSIAKEKLLDDHAQIGGQK